MVKGAHLVRWCYKAWVGMIQTLLSATRRKWEEALDRALADKEWARITEYPQKIYSNTRLKYLQFNYLHQSYLIPSIIMSIYGGKCRNA